MGDYRILVTGSRDWGRPDLIREHFAEAAERAAGRRLIVMHGMCDPRHRVTGRRAAWDIAETWPHDKQFARFIGADWLADRIAGELGWETRRRPADWTLGKSAGFARNGSMVREVSEGDGECQAYVNPCTKPGCPEPQPHGSHGTVHCVDLAERAGIKTRRFNG